MVPFTVYSICLKCKHIALPPPMPNVLLTQPPSTLRIPRKRENTRVTETPFKRRLAIEVSGRNLRVAHRSTASDRLRSPVIRNNRDTATQTEQQSSTTTTKNFNCPLMLNQNLQEKYFLFQFKS